MEVVVVNINMFSTRFGKLQLRIFFTFLKAFYVICLRPCSYIVLMLDSDIPGTQIEFFESLCVTMGSQYYLCGSVSLTIYFAISQNGQTHFKNLAAYAVRFVKCI